MKTAKHHHRLLSSVIIFLVLIGWVSGSVAGPAEQARFIHDRLAGTVPVDAPGTEASDRLLEQMTDLISAGDMTAAAYLAMDTETFLSVTLRTMAAPWTNRDQTPFVPLNDYIATFAGAVRDDLDLRRLLWDDILYVSNQPGLPPYSLADNEHYAALEAADISWQQTLTLRSQALENGLPAQATAGLLTTRAAARAFFVDGTNRAMLRFTLMNHLCRDLEQLEDTNGVPDRIRQDVSRSPGGDSRLFNHGCIGCHTGMDPLAQAFAYYDFSYSGDPDSGRLVFTPGQVQPKYLINATNFPFGFVTPDDQWDNYWRSGRNSQLGWDPALAGSGQGARSLGQELANSDAFAQCQVRKVFSTVCLREPENADDRQALTDLLSSFQQQGYQLRTVFAGAASYCAGDL
ncbi:MAG: hypothetical protein KDI36_11760 [Pseudomonadales bacterium]|nr:hypothetical protein [Pseudomonadales bacterium]